LPNNRRKPLRENKEKRNPKLKLRPNKRPIKLPRLQLKNHRLKLRLRRNLSSRLQPRKRQHLKLNCKNKLNLKLSLRRNKLS
jgi:hypothetical protein